MKKIVAVVGATGGQGGSVVEALLNNPDFQVRALTRNVDSPNAKRLRGKGVEVVATDLNDEKSLIQAFEGASVIFAVTDFWETFARTLDAKTAAEAEMAQGLNVARAASGTSTLQHFIWSTLPNGRAISNGKHIVPHFESKSRVDDFIKSNKGLHSKTTFLMVGFYAENLLAAVYRPTKVETSSKYAWLIPAAGSTVMLVSGDHRSNTGTVVKAIINRPDLTLSTIGSSKFVSVVTEVLTMEDILQLWGQATKRETVYVHITVDEYNALWPHWGQEMGLMLRYFEEATQNGWGLGPGEDLISLDQLGCRGLVGELDAFRKMEASSED